jgi:D-alanine-D-alanine ligase-like ATP-grasp enzyme
MTIRVNVVMGGPSVEHEISLRSGLEVFANLDKKAYAATAVVVSKKKEFFWCTAEGAPLTADDCRNPVAFHSENVSYDLN